MDGIEERAGGPVASAAAMLGGARRIVVFTGAGISTDRRAGGGHSGPRGRRACGSRGCRSQRYLADPLARRLAWRLRRELHGMRPEPNAAHLACTRLAQSSRLAGVVTQNIDGLHGDAGLAPELVCELHGNGRWVACLSCHDRIPMADAVARVDAGEEDPACMHCGGILKATTVSFGQVLPRAAWERAEAMTATCDAFLAVGSSLVVHPAARLPELAGAVGATLLILNREPTPLDPLADVVLRGECGDLLPHLEATMELIRRAAAQGTPTLGICLGGQLAAHALGGRAYRATEGLEFGWIQLELTPAGRADAVLGALDQRADVFAAHYDVFDLPPGATLLARGADRPNQAFRLGSVVGLQFHPEVDAALVAQWHASSREPPSCSEREVVDGAARHAPAARRVLDAFCQGVAGATAAITGTTGA